MPETNTLTATAASDVQPNEYASPNPLRVQFMAERKVRELLKDPQSMETRNVRVPRSTAYACGEVNSRNSFGGYTGYKRFIAGAGSAMPVAIEEENMSSSEFEAAWQKLCA